MADRLTELNGLVDTKRARMGELLKARAGRDTKQFLAEELSEFTKLNEELTPLTKEQEALQVVERAAQETEAYLAGQKATGSGLPTPGFAGELKLYGKDGKMLPESQIAEQISLLAKKEANRIMTGGEGLDPAYLVQSKAAILSEHFINSEAFTKYNKTDRKSPTVEIDTKALLDTTGFPIASIRSDLIVQQPLRRLTIANLLPQGNISQPLFRYIVETSATNNAAAVAEGGTKPESALAFAEEDAPVRKIATVLPVTDELFEDAPAMRAYVQGRLVVFLQLAEENQILNGSGVAPNIEGILNNSLIQNHNRGADSYADALYKACTKIQVVSQLTASAIVLHPTDWQTIRLSKETGTGAYLFGSPLAGDIERVFGYPIVKTTAIAQGTALPGAYDLAAMLLRRTGITFAVSTEHADFFIKNQLMLRVEERIALPVFRPEGFCETNFLA